MTSKWRPEGWDGIKSQIKVKAPDRYDLRELLKQQDAGAPVGATLDVITDALMEETADVILEALRGLAHMTTYIDGREVNLPVGGHFVFVPDESTKIVP